MRELVEVAFNFNLLYAISNINLKAGKTKYPTSKKFSTAIAIRKTRY
jgi:hypothetical protein